MSPTASMLLMRDCTERARLMDGMPRSPAMGCAAGSAAASSRGVSTSAPNSWPGGVLENIFMSGVPSSRARRLRRSCWTSGALRSPQIPCSRCSRLSFPGARSSRRATRCRITSPSSMLKFRSDSEPSSFRTKIAGSSACAANLIRVCTPSSEAATGWMAGLPQYQ